jgi:hypothetical protein
MNISSSTALKLFPACPPLQPVAFLKTAGNRGGTAKISLFFGRQAVGGPGFPPRTRYRSLLICRRNSENSEKGLRLLSPTLGLER